MSGANGDSSWAAAVDMLECSLGACAARILGDWEPFGGADWYAAAGRL